MPEEYFLSLDSIKKIVYGKKEKELLFEATVESAVKYSDAGLLEEWMSMFYRSVFKKAEVCFEEVVCCGVSKVPLRLVEAEKLKNGGSTIVEYTDVSEEPLLISYVNGSFFVDCQPELFWYLKQQKINAYPAVLMIPKEEYKVFERMYGRHFVTVRRGTKLLS